MEPDRHDCLTVLIADPDPVSSQPLEQLCGMVNGIHLAGVARSGQMLAARTRSILPDLVFLDLSPDTGGLEMIGTLKQIRPDINVIVVYPSEHDSDALVAALEAGVYECFEKPGGPDSQKFKEFRLHLFTVAGLLRSRKRFFNTKGLGPGSRFFMPLKKEEAPAASPRPATGPVQVVAIAASTGGPEILSRIFSILPGDLNVPVLLVQHIPRDITRFFARSLNRQSELTIAQAEDGETVLPSRVYVAPGGQHMTVSRPDADGCRTIGLNTDPPVKSVRPSADVLFQSIAESYSGAVLAVVLTGMGEDGREGVVHLKEKTQCTCVSQEARSCVVYGMPRAVDEAGLSDESLDPLSITQKIVMCSR